MSKFELERQMRNELAALNRTIDRKIMLGLSYRREAREHKALLSRIVRQKRATGASIFDRFSFASGLF